MRDTLYISLSYKGYEMEVTRKYLWCLILGLVLISEFSCVKPEPPLDVALRGCAALRYNLKDNEKVTDSFYLRGIKDGKEWKAYSYKALLIPSTLKRTLTLTWEFTEIDDSCHTYIYYYSNYNVFKSLGDTVYQFFPEFVYDSGGIPKVRATEFKILADAVLGIDPIIELKNDFITPNKYKDDPSISNYITLEGLNADSTIMSGHFQFDLKHYDLSRPGALKVTEGKFRIKVEKEK